MFGVIRRATSLAIFSRLVQVRVLKYIDERMQVRFRGEIKPRAHVSEWAMHTVRRGVSQIQSSRVQLFLFFFQRFGFSVLAVVTYV